MCPYMKMQKIFRIYFQIKVDIIDVFTYGYVLPNRKNVFKCTSKSKAIMTQTIIFFP